MVSISSHVYTTNLTAKIQVSSMNQLIMRSSDGRYMLDNLVLFISTVQIADSVDGRSKHDPINVLCEVNSYFGSPTPLRQVLAVSHDYAALTYPSGLESLGAREDINLITVSGTTLHSSLEHQRKKCTIDGILSGSGVLHAYTMLQSYRP